MTFGFFRQTFKWYQMHLLGANASAFGKAVMNWENLIKNSEFLLLSLETWLEMWSSAATSPLTSSFREEESLFHMPSRSLLSIFAKCCFILRKYNLLHPLLFRIIHKRIEIFFSLSWFTRHDKCSATSNRFTKCCFWEKHLQRWKQRSRLLLLLLPELRFKYTLWVFFFCKNLFNFLPIMFKVICFFKKTA